MREKVTVADPTAALMRLLDVLAADLAEAGDDEIMQAAADLGMDPRMKGSAAFAGLKYPCKPRLSDFYDLGFGTSLPAHLQWMARQTPKDADEK